MSTDYDDRLYDVRAWNASSLTGGMVGPDTSGEILTGVMKLGQRFLIILLSTTDSFAYTFGKAEQGGTSFYPNLQSSNVNTEADVYTIFTLAVAAARSQMRDQETEDDPDDEQFDSATLSQVVLNDDAINLYIVITSKAGNSAKYIVPISYLPG